MNFYSHLTIFYQKSPHFEGKETRFVATLAQNTCVCSCRPGLYYPKVNIGWLERFMKPGMGIMDILPVQPHHFLAIFDTANPYFRGNLHSFVATFTKITCLCGCRLCRYQWKVNISSSERYMCYWRAIKDIFIVQAHHILHTQPIFWSKL